MKKFLLYARRSEIRGVDIDNPYFNFITAFTVPDIDDVTVIDFDASEERLYWTDIKTQTIKRAFINGTGLETVISRGKRFVRVITLKMFVIQFVIITSLLYYFSITQLYAVN